MKKSSSIILILILFSFISVGCYNNLNTSKSDKTLDEINSKIVNLDNEEKANIENENIVTIDNEDIVNVENYDIDNNEFNKLSGFLDKQGGLIIYMNNEKFNIELNMNYVGINSIYSISKIAYTLKSKSIADDKKYRELISVTDWLSPYIMRSLLSDENNDEQFTGGWHGTNGDETGENTAFTEEVIIYCDNNRLKKDNNFKGDKVSIEVINLINGYNTKYPILKEKVIYTITNGNIDVYVESKAIEKLEILRYYGLQTQNTLWDGEVKYIYRNNKFDKYPLNNLSNSAIKNDNLVKEYELISSDNLLKLNVGILENGLGNFEYLSEDKPSSFTASYGKTYFNLINGKSKILDKDNILFFEGYYQFFKE